MLFDEVKLQLKAGDGGAGCTSFRREKFVPFGGPDGGNGGRGGTIIVRSANDANGLMPYRHKTIFKAPNGRSGAGANKTGHSGEDMILVVPIGTQIFNEAFDVLIYDFTIDKQDFVIAKGGDGGFGNINFKSSVNQAPKRSTGGFPGEELTINLRLKLFCDVGIIGKPNAGKSTLLSRITNAKPKIADYPFTTLSPNLGIVKMDFNYDSFVVADIPGLIEGASLGVGLGDKFLQHIERCITILHLIDCSGDDVVKSYDDIRKELEDYDKLFSAKNYKSNLTAKKEIIALSRCDICETKTEITKKQKTLIKHLSKIGKPNIEVLLISSLSPEATNGLKTLVHTMYKGLKT